MLTITTITLFSLMPALLYGKGLSMHNTIRNLVLSLMLAMAIPLSARASPPTALPDLTKASTTAGAWVQMIGRKNIDDIVNASAYPFRMIGFDTPGCSGDRTAQDEQTLRSFIKCITGELVTEETEAALAKGDLAVLDARDLKRAGWRKQRKVLQTLQREERLFWRLYPDEDLFRIVVVGVRQTPGGPRVTSISYHTDEIRDE